VYAPKGDGKSKLPLSFIAEDPKITNTYLKSPYAYSQGDPHYYGFNKVWFDFNGTIGNYYNIISDVVRFFFVFDTLPSDCSVCARSVCRAVAVVWPRSCPPPRPVADEGCVLWF